MATISQSKPQRQIAVYTALDLKKHGRRMCPVRERQHFFSLTRTVESQSYAISETSELPPPRSDFALDVLPLRNNLYTPQPCIFLDSGKLGHMVKSHFTGIVIKPGKIVDVPLGFTMCLKGGEAIVGFQEHLTLIQSKVEVISFYIDPDSPLREFRVRLKNNHLHQRFIFDLDSVLGFIITKP